jgi:hypothetical protein
MKTQYTPGPWESMGFYISARNERLSLPNTQTIARVFPDHQAVGGNTLANARIISAAPDLLSALELLLSRSGGLDRSATHDGLQNCEAIAQAREAIRKAKGE